MESLDANVTFLSFLFLSCVCIQVGLGVDPNDDDKRVPLLVWEACAYTIQSGGQFILKLIDFFIHRRKTVSATPGVRVDLLAPLSLKCVFERSGCMKCQLSVS